MFVGKRFRLRQFGISELGSVYVTDLFQLGISELASAYYVSLTFGVPVRSLRTGATRSIFFFGGGFSGDAVTSAIPKGSQFSVFFRVFLTLPTSDR